MMILEEAEHNVHFLALKNTFFGGKLINKSLAKYIIYLNNVMFYFYTT